MLNIRQISAEDYPAVYALDKTAFQTAEVSNGKEQDYVEEMRASTKYVPELELVVEKNGDIIGHIMFTEFSINASSFVVNALELGPICVKEEYRLNGIGGRLIEYGERLAVNLGYTAVFLVGNPLYYKRYGYSESTRYGIKNSDGIPDKNVMCKELKHGVLDDITAEVSFM